MSKQSLHLFTPVEIAEELTLRDAELLRRIGATEIRNGAWMDKQKQERAPNVLAMVDAFNSLAQLVAREILAEESLRRRAEVIATYIKVAKKCYGLRNYNSLNAVLAGLMCTPVHRLKKTWKEVPSKRKKQLGYLSNLMSEDRNWRLYKRELAKHVSTNTTCIIFLGVLLSNVVRYESYQQLKRSSGLPKSLPLTKKLSVCETFTVLEAITVRNRLRKMSRRELGEGRRREEWKKGFVAAEEEGESVCILTCGEESTVLHNGDATEKMSILSLSDVDSNGDLSPDLPDLDDDWSLDVCHHADRRLGNQSLLQKPRPLIKRGRSLEQLLRVCQTADDDEDLDNPVGYDQMLPTLSRSLPRLSCSCSHDWDNEKSSPCEASPTLKTQGPSFDSIDKKSRLSVEYNSSKSSNEAQNDDEISRIGSATTLNSEQSDFDNEIVPTVHVKRSQISHEAESPPQESSDVEIAEVVTPGKNKKKTRRDRQLRKRYTASDELDVIQLQTAREEPSSNPVTKLNLYQFLSLGYSVRFTSSPYIREIISSCCLTASTEAQNYRRSYTLEGV